MAVGPDPVQRQQQTTSAHGGHRSGALEPRLARPDQGGLIDQIGQAQDDPPVGLVIVGWERLDPPGGPVAAPSEEPTYDQLVERSVGFVVAACAGRSDRLLAAAETEVAIVRSPLSGPATAESLAHHVAKRLDVELDRLAISADRPAARWAIGVAVGRRDDRAVDLLRYAEAALDDAWLLGGRRLVAFDDGDRDLLDRPPTLDD